MKTKEDYINEYWEHIISDVSYNYYDDFGEDYEEQIDEWAETFANRRMKEQEENNKELTKYKRAFEILKDNFFIDLIERQDDWKLGFEPINPIEEQPRFSRLPKEEAELLEELMSDGKI